METEKIFGFTYGSSTESQGVRKLAIESVGRIGKRMSDYGALGQKIEFAYAFTDRLTMSATVLGDYHRVRARSGFEADVEPVRPRYVFNGFGGEIRYRLLDRNTAPFGLTLHLEPSLAMTDEASGLRARKFGSENKIIFDRALIADKVFAAINLTQEVEIVKERGAAAWERASVIGVSAAAAWQARPGVFLGGEVRYLRAYESLGLSRYAGEAIYAGPTLTVFTPNDMFLSLAYNNQISGSERGSVSRRDLVNFERHLVRLKAGFHF